MNYDRLVNRTLMTTHAEALEDIAGRRVLTVIAKMTWSVGATGEVSIAAPAQPVRQRDVTRSVGGESSLVRPSDLCAAKPGTDVILVATAQPPMGRTVTEIDVGLRITASHGVIQKGARVHGPRVYQHGALGVVPGPAVSLSPTPLIYELTYGGADRSDPMSPLIDWRNPIGIGVARDRASLVGRPAPAIVDLIRPLTDRAPAPAGFGAIPAHWAPRSELAGTFDERWRRERAPLLPIDVDPRFFCSSAPGLWSAAPLRGDELIELVGVTPEGLLRFRLPYHPPVFTCDIRGEVKGRACPTHLDTLLIDSDRREVELTFRTSIPAPRKLQAIERVVVEAESELPDRVVAEHRERSTAAPSEERA